MAKSIIKRDIELKIVELEVEANNLYHKRNEVLAKLKLLRELLKDK